jgi:hypothetical protein
MRPTPTAGARREAGQASGAPQTLHLWLCRGRPCQPLSGAGPQCRAPAHPPPRPTRLAELLQSGQGGDAEAGSHLGGLVAGGGRKKAASPSVSGLGRGEGACGA